MFFNNDHFSLSLTIIIIIFFVSSKVQIINGDKYDLKTEYNQCRSVFGFCQKPLAAMFNGGFFIHNTTDNNNNNYYIDLHDEIKSCHKGIFDIHNESNNNNKEILNASNNTMQLINKDWCDSYLDRHKVNCFGIPQCGRGSSCNYDYSCLITNPQNITNYFNGLLSNLLFRGSLKFKNGEIRKLQCIVNGLPLPFANNSSSTLYVHGIDVLITPDNKYIQDDDFLSIDQECLKKDLKFNPVSLKKTLYKKYTCVANAIIKTVPIQEGDVFQHTYKYDVNSAGSLFQIKNMILGSLMSLILLLVKDL